MNVALIVDAEHLKRFSTWVVGNVSQCISKTIKSMLIKLIVSYHVQNSFKKLFT